MIIGKTRKTRDKLMKYTIREIQPQDDRAVEHIIRVCLKEFGGDREGTAWCDPDLGRFSEIYSSPGCKYWVAVDETGAIAGGAGIGPLDGMDGVCELQKMYCLPAARGTGVAGELMARCLDYARTRYDTCYLETFGNMLAARRFYAKHGFTRLDAPMGGTGHWSCDVWCARGLNGPLILPYTRERVGDVLDFERRLREEEPGVFTTPIDEAYRGAVERAFADPRFDSAISLLAYLDGQVVGRIDGAMVFSRFDGNAMALLDWLCVLKSRRHKGVAQALMAELRSRAKAAGAGAMIGLIAANREAQRFYRAMEGAKIQDEGIWIDL